VTPLKPFGFSPLMSAFQCLRPKLPSFLVFFFFDLFIVWGALFLFASASLFELNSPFRRHVKIARLFQPPRPLLRPSHRRFFKGPDADVLLSVFACSCFSLSLFPFCLGRSEQGECTNLCVIFMVSCQLVSSLVLGLFLSARHIHFLTMFDGSFCSLSPRTAF